MKMGQKDNFMERNNLYPIFLKTKNLNVVMTEWNVPKTRKNVSKSKWNVVKKM